MFEKFTRFWGSEIKKALPVTTRSVPASKYKKNLIKKKLICTRGSALPAPNLTSRRGPGSSRGSGVSRGTNRPHGSDLPRGFGVRLGQDNHRARRGP